MQTTVTLEDYGFGGPDMWALFGVTATAEIGSGEVWDRNGRTVAYYPVPESDPKFTVKSGLGIVTDTHLARLLVRAYHDDHRFRAYVEAEILAQAEREIESAKDEAEILKYERREVVNG